jgi:hypothetical protein
LKGGFLQAAFGKAETQFQPGSSRKFSWVPAACAVPAFIYLNREKTGGQEESLEVGSQKSEGKSAFSFNHWSPEGVFKNGERLNNEDRGN